MFKSKSRKALERNVIRLDRQRASEEQWADTYYALWQQQLKRAERLASELATAKGVSIEVINLSTTPQAISAEIQRALQFSAGRRAA